jgi:glutathione peroxidase
MSIYSFTVKDANGHDVPLSVYQGKVLLIVNTASQCGYTPQYADLQQLYTMWSGQGLEILAFPCDQFGHQEPGTDDEIQQFCQVNYGVTFPVFSKIEVNGEHAHPLFQFLTAQKPGPKGSAIDWNFTKFLVDRNGNVLERFEPAIRPGSAAQIIENVLTQK